MSIGELPTQIKDIAIARAIENGKSPSEAEQCDLNEAFAWEKSPEGSDVWTGVLDGNYDAFFRQYPHLDQGDISQEQSSTQSEQTEVPGNTEEGMSEVVVLSKQLKVAGPKSLLEALIKELAKPPYNYQSIELEGHIEGLQIMTDNTYRLCGSPAAADYTLPQDWDALFQKFQYNKLPEDVKQGTWLAATYSGNNREVYIPYRTDEHGLPRETVYGFDYDGEWLTFNLRQVINEGRIKGIANEDRVSDCIEDEWRKRVGDVDEKEDDDREDPDTCPIGGEPRISDDMAPGYGYDVECDTFKTEAGIVYFNGQWAEPEPSEKENDLPGWELNGYEPTLSDGMVEWGCFKLDSSDLDKLIELAGHTLDFQLDFDGVIVRRGDLEDLRDKL